MKMRGRVMKGYVYVDPPIALRAVREWMKVARAFVGTLPPKSRAKQLPRRR